MDSCPKSGPGPGREVLFLAYRQPRHGPKRRSRVAEGHERSELALDGLAGPWHRWITIPAKVDHALPAAKEGDLDLK